MSHHLSPFVVIAIICLCLACTQTQTTAETTHETLPAEEQEQGEAAVDKPAGEQAESESTEEIGGKKAQIAMEEARNLTHDATCPSPWNRTRALGHLREAAEHDPSLKDEIVDEFGSLLSGRVRFHEITGDFDAHTWEALEEVLVAAEFHETSSVPHLPWGSLSFEEDGTYTYKRRLTHNTDVPEVEFETIRGAWNVLEATPKQDYAILELDGEEFIFGPADRLGDGNENVFVLHRRDELDVGESFFDFVDEEYEGELC